MLEHVWQILQGIGIGILFSVPVGPVNVMCIREAFQFGFRVGLAAAFGAVCADITFAALAAFGMTAISHVVNDYALIFQAIAALSLIYIGQRVARSTVSIDEVQDEATIGRAGLTGFGMTLSNPATIFGFIAVFGALGDLAPDTGDYVGAAFLVLGVAAGGFGWWFLLVSLIALVRRRMTLRGLERINHAAGGVLLLCGFGLLARVVWVMVTSPA